MDAITAAITSRRRRTGGTSNPAQPYTNQLILSGPTAVIATHQTNPFTVVVKDQFGNVRTNQVYNFASSNASAATITAEGVVTGVTGVAGGTTDITAWLINERGSRITSNAITVTVAAQVATGTIPITPSSATLSDAGTLQLSGVVSDQGSPANVIAGAVITWTSDTPSKATVGSSTGLVSGAGGGAGTATITATCGSATGTCVITTTAASHTVTSVSINPTSLTTTVGGTPTVVGTVKDENGNPMPGESVTYSSDSPSHATVDSTTGQVTGVANGSANIIATSVTNPAKSATCAVTVSNITWATRGIHPDAFWSFRGADYAGADDAARTAALQNDIATTVGGTNNTGTAKFTSGFNGSYASVVSKVPGTNDVYPISKTTGLPISTSILLDGNPVVAYHQPASTGITPQLWGNFSSDIDGAWFRAKWLFPPGWTNNGSGYKRYFLFWPVGINQRLGHEITGGGEIIAIGINSTPPYSAPCSCTSDMTGYISHSIPWSDGDAVWKDLISCWYQVNSGLYRFMTWESNDGVQPALVADMYMMLARGTWPKLHGISVGANKNLNQSSTQDQYLYQGQTEVVPYSVNPDPYGLIALAGGNIDTIRMANACTVTGISGLPAAGSSSTITITGTNLNRSSSAYLNIQISNLDASLNTSVFGAKTIVNSTTITVPFNASALSPGTYYLSLSPKGNGFACAQTRPFAFTLS